MTNPSPDYVEKPSCFGLLWQGDYDEEYCKGCAVKNECLHVFALEQLPRVRSELGPKATLKIIAEHTKVMPEAIVDAVAYRRAHLTKPHDTSDISKAFDVGDEESVPLSPDSDLAANHIDVEFNLVNNAEEKPVAKKKKAPAKKKAKRKAKSRSVDRPRRAGPAQRASGPVMTKLSSTSVKRATALALQTRNWGDDKKRWQRERDRTPAIAALTRGSTLTREYKGETFKVKVLASSYKILNSSEEHPTLYSVTKAITGLYERQSQRKTTGEEKSRPNGQRKLTNWSATKFWAKALSEALYGKQKVLPRKHPSEAASRRKRRAKAKSRKVK